MLSFVTAIAAAALVAGPLPAKPPRSRTVAPARAEPDCSGTRVIRLPPMRVFGMAPTKGVDWQETIESKLSVSAHSLPAAIEFSFRLSGEGSNEGQTEYEREQTLRWPVAPPPGCEVSHWKGGAMDSIPLEGRDEYKRVYGKGLVDSALCIGDVSDRSKMGKTGCRSVQLHPITVHFKKRGESRCGSGPFVAPPIEIRVDQVARSGKLSGAINLEVDVRSKIVDGTRAVLETRVSMEEVGGDHARRTSDWQTSIALDGALMLCRIVELRDAEGRLRDRSAPHGRAGFSPTVYTGESATGHRTGIIESASCRMNPDQSIEVTGRDASAENLVCMIEFEPFHLRSEPL